MVIANRVTKDHCRLDPRRAPQMLMWPGVCPGVETAAIPGRTSSPSSNSVTTASSITSIRRFAPTAKAARASPIVVHSFGVPPIIPFRSAHHVGRLRKQPDHQNHPSNPQMWSGCAWVNRTWVTCPLAQGPSHPRLSSTLPALGT